MSQVRMIRGQSVDDYKKGEITDFDELGYYPITHAHVIGDGTVGVQVMRGGRATIVVIPEGLYAKLPTMNLMTGDEFG